jgi:hypothetical protein
MDSCSDPDVRGCGGGTADSNRGAVVRALEALRDGNPDDAEAFLESALEPTPTRLHSCASCGLRFDFPGQLDNHLQVSHPEFWDEGSDAS